MMGVQREHDHDGSTRKYDGSTEVRESRFSPLDIDATTTSLHDRLRSRSFHLNLVLCLFNLFSIEHREHGNRIMHEFLLGQENIKRNLPPQGKTSKYDKSVVVILQ